MTTPTELARRWLEECVSERLGIQPSEFESIADCPVYEVFDSLDLVEIFATAERKFCVAIEPGQLPWAKHPTVRQLITQIADCVRN